MKYGSICSGIEAASVAWHSLGWQCQFVSEIEPFPCSLLNHHYPTVPNYGDMTKHHEWPKHDLDVLVGGTPCQAFSVAGLRAGLADPRGNLTLTFLSIVEQYQPRWVVWENVPGVLSDKTGAFGAFLGGLGQLGYGFAYRVLDAQYFGLAQRRKRVFVVGHIGRQWQRAAAVLFERESLRGDSAPVREARKDIAGRAQDGIAECGNTISKCNAGGGAGKVDGCNYIPVGQAIGQQGRSGTDGLGQRHLCADVSTVDAKNMYDHGDKQHCERLIVENMKPELPEIVGTLSDGAHMGGGLTGKTLTRDESFPQIAWALQERDAKGPDSSTKGGHLIPTHPKGFFSCAVRRLTPRECERLQGFPDDYTLTLYRGKPASDGPRYKALGNSMAVPVMKWIGERITKIDSIK